MSDEILISVLIPTRHRPENLKRCIKSILDTAHKPDRIEFVLRIDDDDGTIAKGVNLQVLRGPRIGHARHSEMYWQMAQAAKGRWIWLMNDDAGIAENSYAWDLRLDDIETRNVVLSPASNKWGQNRVTWNHLPQFRHHTCHFPILPNRFWEQCGMSKFEEPLDTFLLNRLTGMGFGGRPPGLGWFLGTVPNLHTFHDQQEDELFREQARTTFFGTEKDGNLIGYESK